jgi:serine/threonine protein kinase
VVLGVQALHSLPQPVSHRDIKAENVLLGDDGRYKCTRAALRLVACSSSSHAMRRLCDFGSASNCNRV